MVLDDILKVLTALYPLIEYLLGKTKLVKANSVIELIIDGLVQVVGIFKGKLK